MRTTQPVRKLSQAQRLAIIRRHKKDQFDEENVDTDSFVTTSQLFNSKNENFDVSPNRTNFKKKTAFSQYYNAYFQGGVCFNPPVNGV